MNPTTRRRCTARSSAPDKIDLVAALLPQVFQWARAVDPDQPLTSGVWQGDLGRPGTSAARLPASSSTTPT